MKRKRFYDEKEKEIRSKPQVRFYKKWWFWIITIIFLFLSAFTITSFLNKVDKNEPLKAFSDEKDNQEKTQNNTSMANSENAIIAEKEQYSYEDFEGTYLDFEGEAYESPVNSMNHPIINLNESNYESFNRWDYEMNSPITEKNINENVLTIEVDSDENEIWGRHSESGTEKFELHYDGDKKFLYSKNDDVKLYSLTNEDLQKHYDSNEIDYARIIMTVHKIRDVKEWDISIMENDGTPVIDVFHNSAGDNTDASKYVTFPEDVTHLSLTRQSMAAGVITFSELGNGFINRYPMPLHYHQKDQSEEGYRKLAQDAIDHVEKIYIEPFEPYEVADFIENVEFLYE